MNKAQILAMLQEEFERWEALLAGLGERRITARVLPGNWSVKDVMAHLRAWQQRSIARLEAALDDREPEFPWEPAEADESSEDDPDETNAWIYETYRDQPWPAVYQSWREGFVRFLTLGEAIPEEDLLDPMRYPWLGGQPLSMVLTSSYDHHHQEHLEPLVAWLRELGTLD